MEVASKAVIQPDAGVCLKRLGKTGLELCPTANSVQSAVDILPVPV